MNRAATVATIASILAIIPIAMSAEYDSSLNFELHASDKSDVDRVLVSANATRAEICADLKTGPEAVMLAVYSLERDDISGRIWDKYVKATRSYICD